MPLPNYTSPAGRRLPVEIAAHFDLRPEMAERAAEQYGGKAYTNLEQFFDAVDVVDICTPGSGAQSQHPGRGRGWQTDDLRKAAGAPSSRLRGDRRCG